jgi:hypothetical protein
MADPALERAYREEAKRLAFISEAEQRAVVAWIRDLARNRALRKADREAARERAEALERLLKLAPKTRKKG